jgi:hypothetical protein
MKTLLSLLLVFSLLGVSPSPIPVPNYHPERTTRDGSKDWTFLIGTWRTHYRILDKRLAHSHTWHDCYGTSIITPFWNGGGNLEDGDLACPNKYIGGATLRLYNPQTRQWTLWWATRENAIVPPPQVGHFDAVGVGRFYSHDVWKGTPIITRFQWAVVNGHPHFQQAFSTDGGTSWETNWTTDYVRVPPTVGGVWNRTDATHDGHTGFDFLAGSWQLHIRRLRYRLVGSHDWIQCAAPSTVKQFWAGSGNFQEADLHCGSQVIDTLTFRLYDAAAGKWLVYWATQRAGLGTGMPQIGSFDSTGHGELTGPDTWLGTPVIARTLWTMQNGRPHLEQAFSADHGKTWETNWISDYTRARSPENPTR